jgi:hypothetical protein
MTNKPPGVVLFVLLAFATGFGQTIFQGLTPGKNTKAQAERVLGRPVKELSATLFEYKEPKDQPGVDKVFVQYRDASSAAAIERIELVCDYPGRADRPDGCGDLWVRLGATADLSVRGRMYADRIEKTSSGAFKTTRYHGPPSLLVRTWSKNSNETIQSRIGFYSVDLFDSVVPRNCTGTFLGEWETNRGRLILTDIPGTLNAQSLPDTRGTYSMNGTVTGRVGATSTLAGEWKDATGSGTFELKINPGSPFEVTWPDPKNVFTGTWERTTGRGPRKGTWEGRCVETKTGGNN